MLRGRAGARAKGRAGAGAKATTRAGAVQKAGARNQKKQVLDVERSVRAWMMKATMSPTLKQPQVPMEAKKRRMRRFRALPNVARARKSTGLRRRKFLGAPPAASPKEVATSAAGQGINPEVPGSLGQMLRREHVEVCWFEGYH